MIWMGFYEITLILNKNRVILSQVGLLAVKSIRKIAWVHNAIRSQNIVVSSKSIRILSWVHSQNIVSRADSVREP